MEEQKGHWRRVAGDEVEKVNRGKAAGQIFLELGAGFVLSDEAIQGQLAMPFQCGDLDNEMFTWSKGHILGWRLADPALPGTLGQALPS